MKKLKFSDLKVGDSIKIVRKPSQEILSKWAANTWVDEMDKYVGTIRRIRSISSNQIYLDKFGWPLEAFDLYFPKVKVPKWKNAWKGDR